MLDIKTSPALDLLSMGSNGGIRVKNGVWKTSSKSSSSVMKFSKNNTRKRKTSIQLFYSLVCWKCVTWRRKLKYLQILNWPDSSFSFLEVDQPPDKTCFRTTILPRQWILMAVWYQQHTCKSFIMLYSKLLYANCITLPWVLPFLRIAPVFTTLTSKLYRFRIWVNLGGIVDRLRPRCWAKRWPST